ncbi:MAG: copper resistance protein B, partial [Amphiplicatus sp.]
LLTQRLVLQPRTELNFAVQNIDELGIGSGLSTAEAGLRLRYELKRQFAPYVGVSWARSVGETADFVRADGEDPSALSFVGGVRFLF